MYSCADCSVCANLKVRFSAHDCALSFYVCHGHGGSGTSARIRHINANISRTSLPALRSTVYNASRVEWVCLARETFFCEWNITWPRVKYVLSINM